MYLLSVLILPPLGWWMLAREGRLKERRRKILIYLAAVWFGLWPLLAWRELGRPVLGGLTLVALVLFLLLVGLVWAMRRALRRPRRMFAGRIVGGLASGLVVVVVVCGLAIFPAWRYRDQIKEEMAQPRTFGPAHLDIVKGLPVLHLYGTPEEMGRQYGTILGPALQAEYRYFRLLAPRVVYRQMRRDALTREPLLPPAYRRELKAIAEASGVPYEVLATANLTPRLDCTVLLAWGEATADGSMVFGRNSEYYTPALSDRASLITVWHPKEGMPQLSLNLLGMIGTFSGANEAGLCWANLVVYNARHNALNEAGLPSQFVLREAGDGLGTADALRDHLLKQPALMPLLVAMADAKQAHIVELGTRSAGVRTPERNCLAAGNFFFGDERRNGRAPEKYHWRYDQLIRFTEDHYARIDARNITQGLYAARSPEFNIQAMVFEPARMKVHVSFNRFPAAAGPFVELDLKALFNAPPARGAASRPSQGGHPANLVLPARRAA